jgi:alkylation response protein AidB-like acyl-CoA dehydrogenase
MDFTFTDEQQQFADALRRYLDKSYGFEARQAIVYSDAGVSATHWAAFAELGLTALPVPEEQGGFNGTPVDMLVVMQELGRALVVEPYWATAVGIELCALLARQPRAMSKTPRCSNAPRKARSSSRLRSMSRMPVTICSP